MSLAFIQNTLAASIVETTCAIVQNHNNRLRESSSHPEVLNGGIYYPCEFFERTRNIANFAERHLALLGNGSFVCGMAPGDCFEMIPSRSFVSRKVPNCYAIKENVLPTVALQSIQQGVSLISSSEVCQIAFYRALSQFLGEEKFNFIFASDSSSPFAIGSSRHVIVSDMQNHLLRQWADPLLAIYEQVPIEAMQIGDMVHFCNVPQYSKKHQWMGHFQGLPTICCNTEGEGRFVGLGLSSEGNTPQEIGEFLRTIFNQPPIGLECVSGEIHDNALQEIPLKQRQKIEEMNTYQLSRTQFQKKDGGKITACIRLNFSYLQTLANYATKEKTRVFYHLLFQQALLNTIPVQVLR